MVSQVRRGITDFIGAARPSIADPFLPRKIEEGRLEEIRECIGCNVCYSGDSLAVPIRCTQNPTMGEEWRKGWHPERIPGKGSDSRILIVGAGPAGLEAASALGARGYRVMLAEATRTLGGRVLRESALPGMSEYIRVRDHREQQLLKMRNVEIFRQSEVTADDVFAVKADHVAIATGARWRTDVYDGDAYVSVAAPGVEVMTPDDVMDGRLPMGRTVLFDGDGYYMGGVIAERIIKAGQPVTLVTPLDSVSYWAGMTDERWRIRTHLMKIGVEIVTAHGITFFDGKETTLKCQYSGREQTLPASSLVVVGQRVPVDALYQGLMATKQGVAGTLPFTLKRIGDCEAPAIIAAAIHAGHTYAREMDAPVDIDLPMKHERVDVGLVEPAHLT
jgi:dimethylamine/trimethylamine dehydrogenase